MERIEAFNCPSLTLLKQYVRAENPADNTESIDAHVASCSGCQAAVEELVHSERSHTVERMLRRRAGMFFHQAPQPSNAHDQMQLGSATAGRRVTNSSSNSSKTAIPESIGGYRVVGELGRGSYGVVYQAIDNRLDRDVAIKVPHVEAIRSAGGVEPFLDEARALARLEHPHVVHVYEATSSAMDDSCYIVSQFIAGSNLAELLDQQCLQSFQAVEILLPLVDALQHVHERGIVHRDVKPANILIDHSGKPYLADFGLALKEDEVGCGPKWLGTPAYMSPEQASGSGHLVDGRTDIFSLGVVFYKMLTGKRPFQARSTSQLIDMIVNVDAPSVRQKNRAIPSEIDRICAKALARDLRDRYRSASDWSEDLAAWYAIQTRLRQQNAILDPVRFRGLVRGQPSDLDVQRSSNEFQIQAVLGQGSMGVVYRAWQPSAQREVALKYRRLRDETARLRFFSEIRALGQVEHPNLVSIYTSGADGDRSWYAMELVDGTSIGNLLRTLPCCDTEPLTNETWSEIVNLAADQTRAQEQPLSDPTDDILDDCAAKFDASRRNDYLDCVSEHAVLSDVYVKRVAKIVQDVARAAEALHDKQIVHRDIKPENIVLTRNGQRAVLVDLGIAKLPEGEKGAVTRPREFVGSLRYSSPEQVLDSANVDHRSDIYSLGVTLWELVTLRPIYGIDDDVRDSTAMLKIEVEEPGPVRRYNPFASLDLQAITQKCLEKDPQRRYQNAADLVDDLEQFLQNRPVGARPVGPLTRLVRRLRRRPLVPGLVASIALLVASFVFAALPTPTPISKTIRIGIKPWVGFSPLVVASEMNLCEGFDIALVPVRNTTDARQKLLSRELDASPCLVDSHALGRASRIPSKVVLQLDVSMEADAIVSDVSIQTLADIKGRKVAYMHHEAPHFLILTLCDKFGVNTDEFTHVRVETAQQAADAFLSGRADAAVTYEPFIQAALQRPGSHRLASAADDPGAIIDILTVHEDFLDSGAVKIQHLIAAWMKAVQLLESADPEAIEIACRFLGDPGQPISVDQYFEMAAGMQYSGLAENLAFFRVDSSGNSEFRRRFQAAQDRWDAHHQLHRKTAAKDGDGSEILRQMYNPGAGATDHRQTVRVRTPRQATPDGW